LCLPERKLQVQRERQVRVQQQEPQQQVQPLRERELPEQLLSL
jgi:hypothetical protein